MPNTMPGGEPWPKVSIVTPSYNQAQFIEETIRSVLLQGYPNLEYIIIDGGSDDGSVDIIRKYEPWLAHWVSEPDQGQSHAINKGFERATGEILAYLNSDDRYHPGAVRQAAAALLQHPDVDVVCADSRVVDETGEPGGFVRSQDVSIPRLLEGNCISQPSTFIRRRLWHQLGPFDETLDYVMDYDYWLRAALHGMDFMHVDETWANLRMWEGCKTVAQEYDMALEQLSQLQRLARRPEARRVPATHWRDGLARASLWAARCALSVDRVGDASELLGSALEHSSEWLDDRRESAVAEMARMMVERHDLEALERCQILLEDLKNCHEAGPALARGLSAWLHIRMADQARRRQEWSAGRQHVLAALRLKLGLLSSGYHQRLCVKVICGVESFVPHRRVLRTLLNMLRLDDSRAGDDR